MTDSSIKLSHAADLKVRMRSVDTAQRSVEMLGPSAATSGRRAAIPVRVPRDHIAAVGHAAQLARPRLAGWTAGRGERQRDSEGTLGWGGVGCASAMATTYAHCCPKTPGRSATVLTTRCPRSDDPSWSGAERCADEPAKTGHAAATR